MFDFHIHLARLPQKKQLAQLLLERNYDFIAVSCEPWEWEEVSQLKKEFSTEIKPFKVTYGIHPMIATQTSRETLAQLRTRLEEDPFAMVGEAGIDKRYPGYNDGTQDQIFLAQAGLALELKRDLQIHCVGDYMHVLKLLEEAGFESVAQTDRATSAPSREAPRPIFHRFGGDANFVKKALPYGALFSLHEDSFRKKSTAAAIKLIPESNVFFETDADESFLEPAELLEELEGRLESVRLAYAKSLE
jgi:TatD DNase family protein